MHEYVHAAVGDWQENVQPAAGLLRQQRPKAKFEDLPGGAGLVARPRGYRVDGADINLHFSGAMERVVCPVLIGRESELTELEDALLAANRGDGQIVLLAGEAGVGKSRLATEVQRRAVKIGITVLSGGCSEADLALPYLPFLEALGNYLTAVDLDQVRKGLGSLRRELAHLFPQLEPEAESRETGDPTQAKLRLFEAILALLRLAAQQTGIAAHPRGPALVGRVYPRAARLPDEALARHAN